MRDRLVAAVQERVRQYLATGDTSVILCRAASLEVSALIGPNTGLDAEAFHWVGQLLWLKYLTLPEGDRAWTLDTALSLFAEIIDSEFRDSYSVPAPLQLILECRHDR